MYKKLIVGVDFSETSHKAIRGAVKLAEGLGAEVVLVHALPRTEDDANSGNDQGALRPGIEQQLRDLCARYHSPTVKLDWGVVDGSPADEIATFADRWGGDAIVCGTAGRSGVSRVLLGSVAERIIRIAKVPVLVIGPAVP